MIYKLIKNTGKEPVFLTFDIIRRKKRERRNNNSIGKLRKNKRSARNLK